MCDTGVALKIGENSILADFHSKWNGSATYYHAVHCNTNREVAACFDDMKRKMSTSVSLQKPPDKC